MKLKCLKIKCKQLLNEFELTVFIFFYLINERTIRLLFYDWVKIILITSFTAL